MRIDNSDISGASGIRTLATEVRPQAKAPAPAESKRAPAEDSVETSSITAAAAGDPAKVERLREAVQSGTYTVDAQKVASSIVREHLSE